MSRLQAQIEYSVIAPEAKEESIPISINAQPFSTLDDLKTSFVAPLYATGERGFNILSEKKTWLPFHPKYVGYWSKYQSDFQGILENEASIKFTTPNYHTSPGITPKFVQTTNDYAKYITVKWYRDTALLSAKDFVLNSWNQFCENKVDGWNIIEIFFNSTNRPLRFVKLTGIEFGAILTYSNVYPYSQIDSIEITESIDLISESIQIDSCNFTLKADDENLNILRPTAIGQAMTENQPIKIKQISDEIIIDYGTFYSSSKESASNMSGAFSTVGVFGKLDNMQYLGDVYSKYFRSEHAGNTYSTFSNILNDIMKNTGIEYKSFIQPDLQIRGWLPISSKRQALQQLCMAVGAIILYQKINETDSFYTLQFIEKNDTLNVKSINQNQLINTTKYSESELVTGVEYEYSNYLYIEPEMPDDNIWENYDILIQEIFEVGIHFRTFENPPMEVEFSEVKGGKVTVLRVTSNSIKFEVYEAAADVTVVGLRYTITQGIVSYREETFGLENIKKYSNTLLCPERISLVTKNIYDYWQNRMVVTIDFNKNEIKLNDDVILETERPDVLIEGRIVRLIHNLNANNRATGVIIGKRVFI